jgi:hypothetical protein
MICYSEILIKIYDNVQMKSEHIKSCYLMDLIENNILWMEVFTNYWKNILVTLKKTELNQP